VKIRAPPPRAYRARELIELLYELRVALPGVQVLFAFLLVVPFSQRFSVVTPLQIRVYFAVLLCTAVAALLLIAPSPAASDA
jgi:flagellar biosynthesis protein FliR